MQPAKPDTKAVYFEKRCNKHFVVLKTITKELQ